MRIAMCQINTESTKPDNLAKIRSTIANLPSNTDLIVFPEYSMGVETSGVSPAYVRKTAEDLNGDFVGLIADESCKLGVSVILPIHEQDREKYYDSAVILQNGKIRGIYRKINLFNALGYKERETYEPGIDAVLFALEGWKLGVIICYDLRFPELSRLLAVGGSEALICPAGWYRGPYKEETWLNLLKIRAVENTQYVVGVGNCARSFIGRSCLVSPEGMVESDLGASERVTTVELSKDRLLSVRESLPVLDQARSQHYNLTELQ